MPRTKRLIRWYGRSGAGLFEFVETFTHRHDTGARTIYADPEANLWRVPGACWYGPPPSDWDASKAVLMAEPLVHRYEQEVDYS